MSRPEFDVVLFGATSFVGQILSHYLLQRHGADGRSLRWALAGRSAAKLETLKQEMGPAAAAVPVVMADAADPAPLEALCARTRVVVSTVGPYALYGSPLVEVCARSGTDYCDLTGEVQWIERMIRQHEATARQTGARIVHCCGFDSVPSDLGVHVLQQASLQRHGVPAQRVKLRIKALRGGFSGGTVASLMNVMREVAADPALRKTLGNPYALCPEGPKRPRQPDVALPEYDADAGSWLAPFVMAAINTRVVHRSNALKGWAYGADFTYDEAMMTGRGTKGRLGALGVAAGLGGFVGLAALKPTRWLLERFVVPKPGEGPSPREQANGFYDIRVLGRTAAGDSLTVKVTGDRDPGYGSTAKMLGEAAACLAQDLPKDGLPGGFWTPATALGDRYVQRLVDHAGLSFDVM